MRRSKVFAVIAALGALVLMAAEYGPLPKSVEAAHTVYLFNAGADSAVFDNLYKHLKKWGRWKVVAEQQEADLVLVFSDHNSFAVVPLPSTTTTTSAAAAASTRYGVAAAAASSATTTGGGSLLLASYPRLLTVVDASTGRSVIVTTCERRISASYTAGVLVNRLRKRIENAAKEE